jgi:signal transduction histidine kinase
MRLGSLYPKLALLFGLTFAAVFVVLWGALSGGFATGRLQMIHRNLEHYTQLLAREIGTPPDATVAATLSEQLELDIAWSGPGGTRSIPPEAAPPRRFEFSTRIGEWRYDFRPRRPLMTANWGDFALAIPLAVAVLAVSWTLLHRLLRPLRRLSAAANELGADGWSVRVALEGDQELRALAERFNSMADRIEAMWQAQKSLLIAVSHEFRSPLTRMLVALEFLPAGQIRQDLEDDIRHLDRVTGILLERERLNQRPDLLRTELTELRPWLESMLTTFRSHAEIILDGSGSARLDQDRMALAVTNAVENACRHGQSPITVTCRADSGQAEITVADTGPGISPERLAQWGEPFGASQTGHGLGSSLIRSILQAHRGQATAENLPNGFRVKLTWPL